MTEKYLFSAIRSCSLLLSLVLLALPAPVRASESGPSLSPEKALDLLKSGNDRYSGEKSMRPNSDLKRMKETDTGGQHPYATVIACSDSRVPVELVFDAGIGDIFVIRVAGNVVDTDEAGSIEYGVDHLGTPVLVVLGHTKCGAVTAVTRGDEVHGNIPRLVDNIVPAVKKAKKKLGDTFSPELLEAAIANNVWHSIEDLLSKSPVTAQRVRDGKLKILGAVYHLDTGSVQWLGEHPGQASLTANTGIFSGLPSMASCAALATGMVIILFGGTLVLMVGRKRVIKKLGIKGRVYAAFLSFITVLILATAAGMSAASIYSSQHYTASLIIMYSLVPAVLSLVFAFIFASSILSSFRTVIQALKNELKEKQ